MLPWIWEGSQPQSLTKILVWWPAPSKTSLLCSLFPTRLKSGAARWFILCSWLTSDFPSPLCSILNRVTNLWPRFPRHVVVTRQRRTLKSTPTARRSTSKIASLTSPSTIPKQGRNLIPTSTMSMAQKPWIQSPCATYSQPRKTRKHRSNSPNSFVAPILISRIKWAFASGSTTDVNLSNSNKVSRAAWTSLGSTTGIHSWASTTTSPSS